MGGGARGGGGGGGGREQASEQAKCVCVCVRVSTWTGSEGREELKQVGESARGRLKKREYYYSWPMFPSRLVCYAPFRGPSVPSWAGFCFFCWPGFYEVVQYTIIIITT